MILHIAVEAKEFHLRKTEQENQQSPNRFIPRYSCDVRIFHDLILYGKFADKLFQLERRKCAQPQIDWQNLDI